MLSDEWLPRYRLLETFNIKWNGNGNGNAHGNGNAYDRGDYNSSFALRAVELKNEVKEVKVDDKKLEAVPEFSYLGDNMLSSGGGCELAAITCCKCASGKFCQLLPLLTSRSLPLLNRGLVYSTCVRSVMLHAA